MRPAYMPPPSPYPPMGAVPQYASQPNMRPPPAAFPPGPAPMPQTQHRASNGGAAPGAPGAPGNQQRRNNDCIVS